MKSNIKIHVSVQETQELIIPINHFNIDEEQWDNMSKKEQLDMLSYFVYELGPELLDRPNWEINGFNKTDAPVSSIYNLCVRSY